MLTITLPLPNPQNDLLSQKGNKKETRIMSTETVNNSTYRPSADDLSKASSGNFGQKWKVDAKEGVIGRYGQDATGKSVLIERRDAMIGLLKEWTHLPAYVLDKDTGAVTAHDPKTFDDDCGTWIKPSDRTPEMIELERRCKKIPDRWVGTFETLEGGKEELQLTATTWTFVSLVERLILWDRKSFMKFSLWIGDKTNARGGKIVKANLYEFPEPGKCVTLKSDDENCTPDSAIDFLKSELGDLYREPKAKTVEGDSEALPWDGLNKVLASHGYEEFTGQPEYVEFIRAGLKLPAWDANNCTDWKPVEALCEKHHAKLPAAFLDPFFGE